jgi:hypothetical protein
VFSYDYKAYKNEKAVDRDAEAAYLYVTEVLDVSPQQIIPLALPGACRSKFR